MESVRQRIEALNPEVRVDVYPVKLAADNIMEIIKGYDIICDGSDNFPTHYLINDACVLSRRALVHAGIHGFDGQATVIIPKEGPCYRCLYPESSGPDCETSCRQSGVLGAVAGVLGTVQANEVLKLILKIGESLSGRLLAFNGLDSTFKVFGVKRRDDCRACSKSAGIKDLNALMHTYEE